MCFISYFILAEFFYSSPTSQSNTCLPDSTRSKRQFTVQEKYIDSFWICANDCAVILEQSVGELGFYSQDLLDASLANYQTWSFYLEEKPLVDV